MPEIKEAMQALGVEDATAAEMLLIEALVRHKRLSPAKVQEMADKGGLRAGTVIWLRSIGVLGESVKAKLAKQA